MPQPTASPIAAPEGPHEHEKDQASDDREYYSESQEGFEIGAMSPVDDAANSAIGCPVGRKDGAECAETRSLKPVLREGVHRIGPDAEAIVISASLICTQDGSAAENSGENENKGDRTGYRYPISGHRAARFSKQPGASALPLPGEIGEVEDRAKACCKQSGTGLGEHQCSQAGEAEAGKKPETEALLETAWWRG